MRLKEQQEMHDGGRSVTSPAVSSALGSPAAAAVAATAPAAASGVSKAEIAEAERHAKLVTWAAQKAAKEGMPQAATMQAKADQAARTLEALKQQSGGAPTPAAQTTPAAPAAAETIQRTVMSSPLMVEEIAELEKQVRLLTWAAKTAAEKGMPQAVAAQARADQAVQQLMRLKEQQEMHDGGRSVTSPAVSSALGSPAAAAVAATAPAAASGVSKAEIAEAERHAKLVTWAAQKAAKEGMPQAATMQAKADQAARLLEALKEQQASQAAPAVPVPSAPVVATSVIPAASPEAPTREELEQAKKDMNLLVWAAKTAAEKGLPQATMMKAKADAKALEYERIVERSDSVRH